MNVVVSVQSYVKERYGYAVKPCWIAHVKSDWGLSTRLAHNRKDPGSRVYPCPPEKRSHIEEALKTLGLSPSKTLNGVSCAKVE